MPVRTARGDDHGIGDRRFSGEIDSDDVLCLAVFQRGEDRLEQAARRINLSVSRKRRRAVDDALSGFRWCQGFYLSSYHPRFTAVFAFGENLPSSKIVHLM